MSCRRVRWRRRSWGSTGSWIARTATTGSRSGSTRRAGSPGDRFARTAGRIGSSPTSGVEASGDRLLVQKFLFDLRAPRAGRWRSFRARSSRTRLTSSGSSACPASRSRSSMATSGSTGDRPEDRSTRSERPGSRSSTTGSSPRTQLGSRGGRFAATGRSGSPRPAGRRRARASSTSRRRGRTRARTGSNIATGTPIGRSTARSATRTRTTAASTASGHVVRDLMFEARCRSATTSTSVQVRVVHGADRFVLSLPVDAQARDGPPQRQAARRSRRPGWARSSPATSPRWDLLEVAVVDHRISASLNGKPLFDPIDYETDGRPRSSTASPLSLGVVNGSIEIKDLRLFRDIYYTGELALGSRRPAAVDDPFLLERMSTSSWATTARSRTTRDSGRTGRWSGDRSSWASRSWSTCRARRTASGSSATSWDGFPTSAKYVTFVSLEPTPPSQPQATRPRGPSHDEPDCHPPAARRFPLAKPRRAPAKPKESMRDFVEQIVIAFILAFLIRGFDAEAFVIPTGSMAPTLMGRHKEVTCPECGHLYAINASDETEEFIVSRRLTEVGVCGNCRYRTDVDATPSFKGDRILVMKFPYELPVPARFGRAEAVGRGGLPLPREARNQLHQAAGGAARRRPADQPRRHPDPAERRQHVVRDRAQAVDPPGRDADARLRRRLSPQGVRRQAGMAALAEGTGWTEDTPGTYLANPTDPAAWADLRYRHLVPDPEQWAAVEAQEAAPARPPGHPDHRLLLVQHQHQPVLLRPLVAGARGLPPAQLGRRPDRRGHVEIASATPQGQLRLELVEAGSRTAARSTSPPGSPRCSGATSKLGEAPPPSGSRRATTSSSPTSTIG